MIGLAILACVLLWIALVSLAPFVVTIGVVGLLVGAGLGLLFWKS